MESLKKTKLVQIFTREPLLVIKYGIAGVSGIGIQLVLLYIFVEIFHIQYLRAVAVAYVIAFVIAFILQKFWTFNNKSLDKLHFQSFSYSLIAAGIFCIHLTVMHMLVDVFHVWYLLAQVIVLPNLALMSFLLNRHITFAKEGAILQ